MTTALTMRAAAAAGALALLLGPAFSAPPAPEPVTPQLIEAATKEGKIVYYTGIDIKVAQALAKNFEKQYPGITVQVERTGSERIFQRVSQERASNIFAADVLDTHRSGAVPDLEEAGDSRTLYSGRTAEMAGRPARSRWRLCQRPLHADADRYQYQPGEAGRRAQELRRPARSEMDPAKSSRRIRAIRAAS